jgi:hypothetical protein
LGFFGVKLHKERFVAILEVGALFFFKEEI